MRVLVLLVVLAAGCALSQQCRERISNCLASCQTADSSTGQRAHYYGDSRTQCERACHDLCRR